MNVRFDREGECQAKLMDDSEVAFHIFNDGINDKSLFGIAVAYDVAAAFRPVVEVLDIVHIQQNGDGISAADCHDMYPENILRIEERSAAILACSVPRIYREMRGGEGKNRGRIRLVCAFDRLMADAARNGCQVVLI